MRYTKQYSIILDDVSQSVTELHYPFKLPYTIFVVNVNEEYKNYVQEIFEFIKPLYQDYSNITTEVIRDFLKKLNEVFLTFLNDYQQEMNVLLVNIK